MSNAVEEKKEGMVYPKCCPICGVGTSYVYRIHESTINKEATWYRCQCGIVFQENFPSHSGYNEDYTANYAEMKEGKFRLVHQARTYANMIEEMTYGRMMLDVGYCVPNNMNYWQDRGWLTWGIDVNPALGNGKNLYTGDFTTFDFDIKASTDDLKALADGDKFKRTFDLIWMNHSFEHFNEPIKVLNKCYNLLSETGVLYIGVPDIDFVHKTGVPGYPHLKMEEHYILWNETALKKEVERAGFKVIMCRRNYSSRYSSWYDIHLLAQKNYF